jgi:hypothetical protein
MDRPSLITVTSMHVPNLPSRVRVDMARAVPRISVLLHAFLFFYSLTLTQYILLFSSKKSIIHVFFFFLK